MTQRIWKYTLSVQDVSTIKMPEGARIFILSPQTQGNDICVWAMADVPNEECTMVDRTFKVYGTGQPIDDGDILTFLGTVMMSHALVFHVFEVSK
jgi:hypothetical protein